jgi:ribosomal protein S18 acetylase RimI-like enzyme
MIRSYKKYLLASAFIVSVCAVSAIYFFYPREQVTIQTGPIYTYDAARDHDDIIKLFELERFWLTVSDYSPTFMLKYMAPYKGIEHLNTLHVAVLRPDGIFAGFTAYYKEDGHGRILFVATRPEFRGKGYGKMLVRHAIADFKKMGLDQVQLVTRTTNIPAQKVYTSLGFDETSRDHGPQGHVYYQYNQPTERVDL